jgi:hypothetical protein
MSSSYLNFYEMSHIPCANSPHNNEAAEMGIGAMNIDGNVVKGGVAVAGQCLVGGLTTQHGYMSASGQWPGPNIVMFGNNVPYAINGWASAHNANAIKTASIGL